LARARDAEVEHAQALTRGHEEVLGLEIAVDDAALVGRGEDVEQRVGDRQHLVEREAPARPRLRPLLERLALEQLHDQKRPALVAVVVEHRHRARVPHRVRHVALAQEARAHLRHGGELGVQHLHRGALAVAVRGRIDRGHAADAEQSIEVPLPRQGLPHTGARLRFDGVAIHKQGEPVGLRRDPAALLDRDEAATLVPRARASTFAARSQAV
jgi:hypothetical protein